MRIALFLLCLIGVLAAVPAAIAADRPAVVAQDLLDPAMFPNGGFGLVVESASDESDAAVVVTTGAEFRIRKADDIVECHQRIGVQRKVAVIRLPKGSAANLKLIHQSTGAAIYSGDGTTIRINCDSLLMIQPAEGGPIEAELSFTPDWHSRFKGSFNFFDPQGGISFFDHGLAPGATLAGAVDPVRVKWPWKAGNVFWAAVSPPKPYNWEKSAAYHVAWHGSSDDRYMYLPDISIIRLGRLGVKVLYLHNEMAWENHQLSLIPKDMANFHRTIATAHEQGMKVIVYASPHFFVKNTSMESKAHPDPHQFIGEHTGANEPLYLEQAKRIVKEWGVDGLYFDEMYPTPEALAVQYHLTRSARELVGDSGPLVLHVTTDVLGNGHLGPVCPPIHTWFDVIYKGEGEWNRRDPGYTRYVLSSHNTSNAMAVQIIDERFVPSPEDIDFWLRANVRFFTPEFYFYTGQIEVLKTWYWPRLNPELQRTIEPDLARRTGVFDQARKLLPKEE